MCVKGIRDVGVLLVVAVHSIKDTTDDEAVPIEVLPQACPPCGLLLGAQVHRIQFAQNNDLLVEAIIANGWVNDPQAILIHSKVHIRVAPPPPWRGLLIGHVMKHCPGSHIPLLQVILNDVAREGPVVIERPIVDSMARSNPTVWEFVGVAPAT